METPEAKFSIIENYYSKHREELKGFIGKQLQWAADTEDIVQNVFVRLMCTDKMITPVTLPSLVYTIARNLIYDYWRHHSSVEEYEHYLRSSEHNNSIDAASVYSAVEITEILERGIARLNDRQRTIYRMNIFEGKKVAEISATLNINYKSVENRLGSARSEIRQYMRRMLA